jgi:hypothetical protein
MTAKIHQVNRSGDPEEDLARWLGLRQKHRSEYVKLLNERKNELLAAQIDHGPRSDAYRNTKRESERHESQFDRISAVIRRPVNRFDIRTWIFWVFAIALALFEAPINKYLFDVAIQGTNLTSYVISAVFAILLLLLAHLAGKCMRQIWSEYRKRLVWSNLLVSVLATLVLGLLVSILTIGRAKFSAGSADPGLGSLFNHIGGEVNQLGFFGSLSSAFSDTSALILFTVNLGAILTAVLLGFFSHDPDKDFDHASTALQSSLKKLADLQKRYANSRTKIIRNLSPDLAGVSRNYSESNNRIIEIKTMLKMPLDDDDKFIIDTLDTLASETDENEDLRPTYAAAQADSDDNVSAAKLRPVK